MRWINLFPVVKTAALYPVLIKSYSKIPTRLLFEMGSTQCKKACQRNPCGIKM
jgi:hypothetical protein